MTGLLYVFALKNRAKQEDFATGWASGKARRASRSDRPQEKAIAQLRNAAMGRVHDQVRCVFIIIMPGICSVRGAKGSAKQFQWNPGDAFPEDLQVSVATTHRQSTGGGDQRHGAASAASRCCRQRTRRQYVPDRPDQSDRHHISERSRQPASGRWSQTALKCGAPA